MAIDRRKERQGLPGTTGRHGIGVPDAESASPATVDGAAHGIVPPVPARAQAVHGAGPITRGGRSAHLDVLPEPEASGDLRIRARSS
jgi:hypothetical protein